MRALAQDQVEVMAALGFDRFAVAGHDRGARCAYRLALDHPAAVSHLAVMDIVPIADAYARADRDFSLGYWVWSFLAAPEPVPERLIGAAPHVLVDYMLDDWSAVPDAFPDEVRAAYVAAFSDPATVHAICEEYRAAPTLDVADDEADRGRRRIGCPTLVLGCRGRGGPHVRPAGDLAGLGDGRTRRGGRGRPLPARGGARGDAAPSSGAAQPPTSLTCATGFPCHTAWMTK